MALVDVRGFGLDAPGAISGAIGRGLAGGSMVQQMQQRQAQIQQAEIMRQLQAQAVGQGLAMHPGQQPQQPQISKEEAIKRLSVQFPEKFQEMSAAMGLDTQQKKNEAADFMLQLSKTPYERRGQLINERVTRLESEGRNASDTKSLLDMAEEDQNNVAQVVQLLAVPASQRIAAGREGAGLRQFAPVTLVNESTGEKKIVIPTADPRSGAARLEPADMPPGFVISTETPEEKRQAEIIAGEQKKMREITGKTLAERASVQIDNALDAADGMANLQRASQLLEQVKTGGIDAVSLRAKQIFGVEGEDEAELSNRLGKAVLSQLRATFGAAFTAKEGEQLSNIEAGFGKSTEGNRRLIEQTIKIVRNTAERGIRAAERIGDNDAANEIRKALEFRLDETEQPQAAAQPPAPPQQGGKIQFLGFE